MLPCVYCIYVRLVAELSSRFLRASLLSLAGQLGEEGRAQVLTEGRQAS